jgi:hypothetical protein
VRHFAHGDVRRADHRGGGAGGGDRGRNRSRIKGKGLPFFNLLQYIKKILNKCLNIKKLL